MLINLLQLNVPLDEPSILKLSVVYRTTITRNLSVLFEGRLICYEPIPTSTKHMSRIIVRLLLRNILNACHLSC